MTNQSAGQDDVAFRAYVEDFTKDFFDEFDNNVSKIAATTETGFANIDSRLKKSGSSWAGLGGVIGGVTATITNLLLNMTQQVTEFAKASVSLAARVDTLGITLEQMGTRAGYSKEQLAEYEEGLKSTGITTQAARTSLTRMIRANINLAESAKLARIAQDSAVVAGINSSAAFERLVLGIQKREPELLDELGITLRRSDAYERLAATLGKSSKELSNAEQQQAILNDIYIQSEAVAGVYDAAMGSVGKQVTSTARYVEELQLALGRAFQPAYQAWVQFMQSNIKELSEWFAENEEAVAEFGEQFGKVFIGALDLLDQVIAAAKSIPTAIRDAGVSLGELIAYISQGQEGVDDVKNNAENLGMYFKQLLSIIAGGINVVYQQISGAVEFIGASVKTTMAILKGDVEGIAAGVAAMDAAVISNTSLAAVNQQFEDGFRSAGQFFGLLETADTSGAETAIDNVTSSVVDLSAAMASAENDLMGLMQQLQMEMAEDAVAETRRLQEEAIKMAHRMEDIQRNHASNVQRILEQANYNKENSVKSYEETRLNLIRDYQRRLRQLQEGFEFEADELARKRDAVGLLRLARSHKKQLEDEKSAREDRETDAKRDYEQRLKEIDEQTRKQLEAAEKQRQASIEQLQLQLDREKEIRDLHAQWELDDRREKYQKMVDELIERYVNEEGLTAEHVNSLLQMWAGFYSSEAEMMAQYEAWKAAAIGRVGGGSSGTNPLGGSTAYDLQRGGIIGQGGQVSQLLAAPTINAPNDMSRRSVPRIPAVSAGRSTSRRELIVKVEGNNLEPVIQRQLVAGLLEVERNRE